MEGFGDDEIESILYIGREVSGMYMAQVGDIVGFQDDL